MDALLDIKGLYAGYGGVPVVRDLVESTPNIRVKSVAMPPIVSVPASLPASTVASRLLKRV